MPITTSAKKALRQDRRRTVINLRIKKGLKEVLRQAREKKSGKTISEAYSVLDRAVKKKVIKKKKAARLKSRLMGAVKRDRLDKKETGKRKKVARRGKKTIKKAGVKQK